jgi:hypothetical protein
VTFVLAAWLMPAANQAFRELMAGRVIPRGMNELTLGELASPQAVALVAWAGPGADRSFAFEFHFRVALAFAPLALALFSLGVATARRGAHGAFAIGANRISDVLRVLRAVICRSPPGERRWPASGHGRLGA